MAKCSCNHCGQPLEFDNSMVGVEVACPSCGMDTELFHPGGVVPEPLAPPEIKVPTPPAPTLQQGNPAAASATTNQHQSDGGVSTIIPYKNGPALIAYYLGVFCIACPPILCLPAIILGVIGLKKVKANPQLKGTAHAWIGIISGSVFLILSVLIIIPILIRMSMRI